MTLVFPYLSLISLVISVLHFLLAHLLSVTGLDMIFRLIVKVFVVLLV